VRLKVICLIVGLSACDERDAVPAKPMAETCGADQVACTKGEARDAREKRQGRFNDGTR
jgi:hypothetical protein